MNYETEIGFFMSEEWRFGPLFAYLPVAGVCLAQGKPFSIEESGTGKILAGFDGAVDFGEDREIQAAIIAVSLLSIRELTLLTYLYENREALEKVVSDENKPPQT